MEKVSVQCWILFNSEIRLNDFSGLKMIYDARYSFENDGNRVTETFEIH